MREGREMTEQSSSVDSGEINVAEAVLSEEIYADNVRKIRKAIDYINGARKLIEDTRKDEEYRRRHMVHDPLIEPWTTKLFNRANKTLYEVCIELRKFL